MASASWWSFSCEAMSKQTIWRDRGKTNLPAERLDVYSVWLLCSHAWETCIYLDIDLYNMSWGAVPQNLGHFFSGRWSYDLLVTSNTITATICAKGAIGSHPRNESWLKVLSLLHLKSLVSPTIEVLAGSNGFFQSFFHGFLRLHWPLIFVCNKDLLIWQ